MFVGEDDVDAFGGVAADVGPEHDRVRRVAAQRLHVRAGREELDVAAAAVQVLLVLRGELLHEWIVGGR